MLGMDKWCVQTEYKVNFSYYFKCECVLGSYGAGYRMCLTLHSTKTGSRETAICLHPTLVWLSLKENLVIPCLFFILQ